MSCSSFTSVSLSLVGPSGTTCDLEHLRCVRSAGAGDVREAITFAEVAAMIAAQRSMRAASEELERQANASLQANDECPDHKSECPAESTCCELESGEYGCCPLPNAVCCSDKEHCWFALLITCSVPFFISIDDLRAPIMNCYHLGNGNHIQKL